MDQEILDIIEILEDLIEDVPLKSKCEFLVVIAMLKEPLDQEGLIKVQDQLELITNLSNLDSYTRNEIYNVLSIIEGFL